MNIHVNQVKLFYSLTGKGKPIFLLHGNGENHHIFDEIALPLSKNFSVYAIDSRNHGQSQHTDNYSYDTMAEDNYQMIKELNLDKVSIVGFSDGAIIGLLIALNHPEVIDKLVLLGANLQPSDFKDEILKNVVDEYKTNPTPLLKLMIEEPSISLEELKKVQSPTLVVGAEHDIFKPETFPKIANGIANSKLIILEGQTHDSYINHSTLIYPEINAFLSEN